jgi:hypothetical protein
MASILKVDTIQDQSGNNIINENADTITIGASGDTISNLGTASGFGTNTPAFRARLSADFVHNVNNTFLKVPFATEDYDTDNAYDSTTNYRFTVPSDQAGKYFVNACIRGDYNAECNIAIYKNGSLTYVADAGTNQNGDSAHSPDITTTMNLSVSNYIEIYVFQQSGGSLTFSNNSGVYPWFEMFKLVE